MPAQVPVAGGMALAQKMRGTDRVSLAFFGDGAINEPIRLTIQTRLTWLVVNLGTALVAAAPAYKDALKVQTQEAVDRGSFGAPTFFVGAEMFVGNDRLDFAVEALADAGLTPEDVDGVMLRTAYWEKPAKSQELPLVFFNGIGANEYIVDITHEVPGPDGAPHYITAAFVDEGHRAMDIRRALHILGEITGAIGVEDLLANIFSKFCIGK